VFLNAIKEAPHPANSPTSSRDEVFLNAINEVPHPEAARSAVSKDGALTRIEQS
jgi:hypothetical protein